MRKIVLSRAEAARKVARLVAVAKAEVANAPECPQRWAAEVAIAELEAVILQPRRRVSKMENLINALYALRRAEHKNAA